jgi:PHD/YefM family antitoxin component YafN of YafNO toxin-antitoxin module
VVYHRVMSATQTFTELLRHPNEVAAQAEQGAVRITRRDAHDLVLMRAGDLEQQEEGITLASRLMRAAHSQGDVYAALSMLDSWFALLDDDEKKGCAEEIDKLLWSAVELGSYYRLLAEYDAWRGTASAYAAGLTTTDGDGSDVVIHTVPRPE